MHFIQSWSDDPLIRDSSHSYHTFMAVSPDTAYAWRRVDLCLVLVLNSLSTYALSYFTLPWLATLAITAVACYCAVTGVCSILMLKKVHISAYQNVHACIAHPS